MRTIIEMTLDNGYQLSPGTGGRGAQLQVSEGTTYIRLRMRDDAALSLKRSLARLVDANVTDPNEGGLSIKELVEIRKTVEVGGVIDENEWDDQVIAIINAYIRLIERVDQASVVKS
jgi:hypothetical protein